MNQAIKHDQGKTPLQLLSPVALEQIATVMGHGAKVYGEYNWTKGMEWSRLIGAALRHLFAWMRGHNTDPDTGLSHLAHAGCCIMFLLEYEARGLGTDDRYKGNELQYTGLPTFTVEEVTEKVKFVEFKRYVPKDWNGTIIDILNLKYCPPEDRIHIASELLDQGISRAFAIWCARTSLEKVGDPNSDSTEACNTAERFIKEEADFRDMHLAHDKAYSVAAAAAVGHLVGLRKAVPYAAAAYAAAICVNPSAKAAAKIASRLASRPDVDAADLEKQITKLKELINGST